MNILFIGNSYTFYNDMPKMLEALVKENGRRVKVDSVTKGGRKLFENLDPEDEKYKQITELLSETHFDLLFLQEQSYFALVDYERFLFGLTELKSLVGADRTALYATWGRKVGSALLEDKGWTSEGMTGDLDKAYTLAAETLSAEVSPVGRYFSELAAAYPELELYNPDLSHPSYLGSCGAAIMHYKTAFGELPQKCDSLHLDSEDIEKLISTAVKF